MFETSAQPKLILIYLGFNKTHTVYAVLEIWFDVWKGFAATCINDVRNLKQNNPMFTCVAPKPSC